MRLGREIPSDVDTLLEVENGTTRLKFYYSKFLEHYRVEINTPDYGINANLLDARDNYYNYKYPPEPVRLESEAAEWITEQVQNFNLLHDPTNRYSRFEFISNPIERGSRSIICQK